MSTKEKIVESIRAGYPGIYIQSDDYERFDREVSEAAEKLGFTLREWSFGLGALNPETRQPMKNANGKNIDLSEYLESIRGIEESLCLIKNAQGALKNDEQTLALFQQTLLHIKKYEPGKVCIIYTSENLFIPDELSTLVYFLEHEPPTREELAAFMAQFVKQQTGCSIDDGLQNRLLNTCAGMSEAAFQLILSTAYSDNPIFDEKSLETAQKFKEQYVAKSGVVKTISTSVNMVDLGGFNKLKSWLTEQKRILDDPKTAKEKYGLSAPKGMLLVGMPGCGKSLAAQVTARFLDVSLIQLDAGSLMGKYQGESEANLRKALSIAEQASPCVLWIDELEKAFAGTSDGGDSSGTMKHLLGYFLTWMQDKPDGVFLVATANNVESLPEELKRRGRFDEIFYVDFPNEQERESILAIHLGNVEMREASIDNRKLAKAMDGYSGTDIKTLIQEAARTAFQKNTNVSEALLRECMSSFQPSKIRFGDEKIKSYRVYFEKYTPVSGSDEKIEEKIGSEKKSKQKPKAADNDVIKTQIKEATRTAGRFGNATIKKNRAHFDEYTLVSRANEKTEEKKSEQKQKVVDSTDKCTNCDQNNNNWCGWNGCAVSAMKRVTCHYVMTNI